MSKLHLYLLAAILTAIGLGLFIYKASVLQLPLKPTQKTQVWTVEARIQFSPAPEQPIKVDFYIPFQPPGFGILDENFISRNYGITTARDGSNRHSIWSIRRAAQDPQTLYYRSVVYEDRANLRDAFSGAPEFVAQPELEEPIASAVTALLDTARAQSADVATMAYELIRRLNENTNDNNVALLVGRSPSKEAVAETAVLILASANIPARIVQGISLKDQQRNAELTLWLEVSNGDRWIGINPATGEPGRPDNFLPWWYGSAPLLNITGGRNGQVTFSTIKNVYDAVDLALLRGAINDNKLTEFSLFNLPVNTQTVYLLLLIVPVGAFMIVLLRTFVGLETFGTFMPVLIALAFRETRLLNGIILFSLVVALGLLVRFYLEHLRLLLIPRLSAVLSIVILLMVSLSILSHNLGLELGLSVALFPMVILAMTIERMSIVWEEKGPATAFKQAGGSLLAAILAYFVMNLYTVQHIVFTFPELLLVLLAVTLLAGRYTGYRVTELLRFKALTQQPTSPTKEP